MKKALFLSLILINGLFSVWGGGAHEESTSSDSLLDHMLVEAGGFQMGSTSGGGDEKPVHTVRRANDFYISKDEVNQKQWKEVMGTNPSSFEGDILPVGNVSWYDAVEFCNKLSEMEGMTPCYSGNGSSLQCNFNADGYRLPTEAEWEYAARGGSKSRGYTYAGLNDRSQIYLYGNFADKNTDYFWSDKTQNDGFEEYAPVGNYGPNELGLYDMSGNVSEWCWDWYDSEYYSNSPSSDPAGPSTGSSRVTRGGGWLNLESRLRVANRNYHAPSLSYVIGFRPVKTAE
jgi:formylglycine-generating enzyme required for sulfatase activity